MGVSNIPTTLRDMSLIGGHPGLYYFEDFLGNILLKDFVIPLFSSATQTNRVTITGGDTITCTFRVPAAGKIATISVIGANTLATSDVNYVTFSLTNKLRSGTGAIVMLDAGAVNTTKATGGSAWTAYVSRSLANSATDSDLIVSVGDVLVFTITVSGVLANLVDQPEVRLQFEEIPPSLRARPTQAAGDKGPYIVPVESSLIGEILLQPQSVITDIHDARIDWNRLNFYNGSKGIQFRTRVKVSGASANQSMVWGVQGSSGTAPHDNATYSAWFRVEGASLALEAETDDNVTDRNHQSTGITLVADTYNIYEVDMRDLTAVRFKFNGAIVQTLSMAGLPANTPIQIVFSVEKTSGTQTDSMTIDWIEMMTTSR